MWLLFLRIVLFVCCAVAGSIVTIIFLRVRRARREWLRLAAQHVDEMQGV